MLLLTFSFFFFHYAQSGIKKTVNKGSLNEYAHLMLTAFNEEVTEAFKSAILAAANAGVEEQLGENEQSDEEAAGEDGQA